MDALKVHQAGYPNVVAILGGQVSEYKINLLNNYFDRVIIFTDNDILKVYDKCKARQCKDGCIGHNPGRDAGKKIRDGFSREVLWAVYSSTTIYPHDAKDPGDLTENEIKHCIDNAIPDYEYQVFFE